MLSLQILASALYETMTAQRAVFWGILFFKKDIRFESDIFKNLFCLCHILSSSLSRDSYFCAGKILGKAEVTERHKTLSAEQTMTMLAVVSAGNRWFRERGRSVNSHCSSRTVV